MRLRPAALKSLGKSIRIVESFREGKTVRQRVVHHVCIAVNAGGDVAFGQLAEHIEAPKSRTRCPGLVPARTGGGHGHRSRSAGTRSGLRT